MQPKPKAVFLLDEIPYERIYGPNERTDIGARTEILGVLTARNWSEHGAICREAELIFSGWGMATLDENFLATFPRLRAIFYGAGSIKSFTTEAFWSRNLPISSAWAANAVPVCEFTLAQIILAAKHAFRFAAQMRETKSYAQRTEPPGLYGTTIGLISLGMIGRMVAERLRQFHVRVMAYDPFVKQNDADALGVEMVSLEELFCQSDVISCHTPWLKETEKILQARHFSSMKMGATFINTARGAVVDEEGLANVLRERPDLWAHLDVVHPEPPAADSPFFTLPNVVLTPHIAGSMGTECQRMGRYMVEELERYLAGQPLRYRISREQSLIMA